MSDQYSMGLTIPKRTLERDAIKTEVLLKARQLNKIDVLFPAGCLGAVGVRFKNYGSQFAPSSGWYIDNDKTVTYRGPLLLVGPPFLIIIESYNRAYDYDHTLQIRFNVSVPHG